MSNSYDGYQDQRQQAQRREPIYEMPQQQGVVPGANKGELSGALTRAAEEAQTLSTYYQSVARQLQLLVEQIEQTK